MTTTLVWKPRFPKRDRVKVLALLREIYPRATDDGAAVTITHCQRDTKPIWLFLFWSCWRDIGEDNASVAHTAPPDSATPPRPSTVDDRPSCRSRR